MNREFRGELDMEVQIENLKKQKQYLQSQCRKAGLLINMQKQELLSLKNVIDNLQKRIDDLRIINEDHQKLNGKLRQELEEKKEIAEMMYEHP